MPCTRRTVQHVRRRPVEATRIRSYPTATRRKNRAGKTSTVQYVRMRPAPSLLVPPCPSDRPWLRCWLRQRHPSALSRVPAPVAGRAGERVGERRHRVDDLAEVGGQTGAVHAERGPVRGRSVHRSSTRSSRSDDSGATSTSRNRAVASAQRGPRHASGRGVRSACRCRRSHGRRCSPRQTGSPSPASSRSDSPAPAPVRCPVVVMAAQSLSAQA